MELASCRVYEEASGIESLLRERLVEARYRTVLRAQARSIPEPPERVRHGTQDLLYSAYPSSRTFA